MPVWHLTFPNIDHTGISQSTSCTVIKRSTLPSVGSSVWLLIKLNTWYKMSNSSSCTKAWSPVNRRRKHPRVAHRASSAGRPAHTNPEWQPRLSGSVGEAWRSRWGWKVFMISAARSGKSRSFNITQNRDRRKGRSPEASHIILTRDPSVRFMCVSVWPECVAEKALDCPHY